MSERLSERKVSALLHCESFVAASSLLLRCVVFVSNLDLSESPSSACCFARSLFVAPFPQLDCKQRGVEDINVAL